MTWNSFYMAASWPNRVQAAEIAMVITKETGAICTSRWWGKDRANAKGGVYGAKAEYGIQDLEDVARADFQVQLGDYPPGPQVTRGGRHSELGAALVLGKTVLFIGEREQVFHHHPNVQIFSDPTSVIRYIYTMRDNAK